MSECHSQGPSDQPHWPPETSSGFPEATGWWLATCDKITSCHLSYTEHSEFVITSTELALMAGESQSI